jgi:hypothetical protein
MSKLFSTVIFSFFLLFQTASVADENNETYIEDQIPQTEESESAEQEPKAEEKEEVQKEEGPSEAELEAQKAEEDEIREAEAS